MKKTILLVLFASLLYAQTNQKQLIERANKLHEQILTIDSHTDTPMRLSRNIDLSKKGDPRNNGGKVDYPRMKEGGLDAAFFAVFLGQGELSEVAYEKAHSNAIKTFELLHKNLDLNKDLAELALTPEDAFRLKKNGKRAIFTGVENGYPIGNDLSRIKQYYDLGARYITLVHTKNNQICDSSNDSKELHGGVSEFGIKVIEEMNRLGIMVDISHASDKAFYDAIKYSKTPIIASHSSAKAICNNPRNLSDDMLKALAKNDGVIQVCILSSYVKPAVKNLERDEALANLRSSYSNFNELDEESRKKVMEKRQEIDKKFPVILATVKDAVDHIDHIVKVAGINHVGIGTDFDGGGGLSDCFDVSEMKNITIELLKRGYSDSDIEKIWSGNLIRVMNKVNEFAVK